MLQSNLKPLSSLMQPGGVQADQFVQKSISQRHSNIEKLRKSQRPSQIGVNQMYPEGEELPSQIPMSISDNTNTSK